MTASALSIAQGSRQYVVGSGADDVDATGSNGREGAEDAVHEADSDVEVQEDEEDTCRE